ncbi:MAG: nucleotidyltransferase domain-containing protein [Bdellovibrionales bacterium]|nr:nucleotidyltransferase domain-containing protein [Bdellovibrionales bacterium]
MLGAQIYCYGSRARGDHKPFSDLDLMVEVNTISPELESKVSEIQEQLTASNFPYKFDLVLSPQFADSYRPGYLRDRVRF